jgi:uncharacterized membrane protein YphA (DoxX/SURF4 family)
MKQLTHIVYRIFFAASFLMAGIAALEKLVNFSGYTFLGGYNTWRLLELSAVALLFVIALQLREMKPLSGTK